MEIKSSAEKYEHLRLKENKAEKFTKAGVIASRTRERQQTLDVFSSHTAEQAIWLRYVTQIVGAM